MWSDSKREEDFRVNFECTSYIFSSGLRESRDWLSTSLPAMTDSPDLLYSPYVCVCVCVVMNMLMHLCKLLSHKTVPQRMHISKL